MSKNYIYGEITRELYEIWRRCVGGTEACSASACASNGNLAGSACGSHPVTNRISGDRVQWLFHQASLYPSQSQILEMIHCAREQRQPRSPTGEPPQPSAQSLASPPRCQIDDEPTKADAFLTFGEFCLFANEFKKCYEREIPRPMQLSKMADKIHGSEKKMCDRKISKSASKYEVFLGGSCNPTTWRQEVAIPILKNLGITYYNPQVPHWGPELIEKEHHAKQTAEVLFFVIDRQTRNVAAIIEAAYYTAAQKKVVLVIVPYEGPGQLVQGEPISEQEYEDLSTGQLVLQDLVERLGIPIFTNIRPALECTSRILREKINLQDLGLSDGVNPVRNSHFPIGDKLIKLRDAFDSLDESSSGELSMAEVRMGFRILTNRDLSDDDVKTIVASNNEQVSVNFEQFCCILTEFRNNPADSKRLWDVLVTKAAALLYSLVTPVSRVLCRPKGVTRCDSTSPEVTVGGARDVYLGGSCGSSTWREHIAIPMLKKSGLTYFNPQVGCWSRRFIPIEAAAIDASRVLLFAITRETRTLSAMALAAHYIGLGCNVVLAIQKLSDDCVINGEKLSAPAIKDYNRGRNYLSDLANREGIPVFEEIHEAMECVIKRCLQNQPQQHHHHHQQQQQPKR